MFGFKRFAGEIYRPLSSSGTSENSFQALQGTKHPNQKKISKNPDEKEQKVSRTTRLVLRSHIANFGASIMALHI